MDVEHSCRHHFATGGFPSPAISNFRHSSSHCTGSSSCPLVFKKLLIHLFQTCFVAGISHQALQLFLWGRNSSCILDNTSVTEAVIFLCCAEPVNVSCPTRNLTQWNNADLVPHTEAATLQCINLSERSRNTNNSFINQPAWDDRESALLHGGPTVDLLMCWHSAEQLWRQNNL